MDQSQKQGITYTPEHPEEVDVALSAVATPKINKSDCELALQDEGWYNSAQEEDLKQYTL